MYTTIHGDSDAQTLRASGGGDTVIRVENLGKKYQLGRQSQNGAGYRTLRDTLAEGTRNLLRRNGSRAKTEEFWALRDVSFDVKEGEVLGIIGRNGAGKSTLLKILSRITDPTTGRVRIKGRVASLLEVGTGFHPELTGRENIFLNGAILGMSRAEIRAKFDEIVAFAEIDKFLDTPVKRYSSGMYVRLAFAVAAHLEPEILIVDEVLAVGDAEFQRKCLGKMEAVRRSGRTVLFVSHQMNAIEALCSRCLVLSAGSVQFDGETKAAINFYLNRVAMNASGTDVSGMARSGNGEIRFTRFWVADTNQRPVAAISSGDDVRLTLEYVTRGRQARRDISVGISIHDQFGTILTIFYNDYSGTRFADVPGHGCFECAIPHFPFSKGRYLVGARLLVGGIEADWPSGFVGELVVEAGDFYKSSSSQHGSTGPLLIDGRWSVTPADAVKPLPANMG